MPVGSLTSERVKKMIEKVSLWFSKVGKGVPQVHLKSQEGQPLFEEKVNEKNEKVQVPVMGNEQYLCEQLTDKSISDESVEAFVADAMEVTGGDLAKASKCFREGWNRITRLETGGDDPYIKAAKGLVKLNLPNYKGMTLDQIADQLRKANQ